MDFDMSNLSDYLGSPIKSIQRGTTTVAASNVDVTITAVVMGKSTVNIIGSGHNGAGQPFGRAQLTTTTNLQHIGGQSSYSIYWEVIEYV
tara:strand:+ start:303 stop:572 length:270 start_codon:yes stop_codon:yes gene_type:complete